MPVILMHAQGDPRTMQDKPSMPTSCSTCATISASRIAASEAAGIPRAPPHRRPRHRLRQDAGAQSGAARLLSLFHGLGCAVLLGASRKSFIGHLTGAPAGDRLPGSLAAALIGAAQGVQILRVHDVAATRQALAVWEGAIRRHARAWPAVRAHRALGRRRSQPMRGPVKGRSAGSQALANWCNLPVTNLPGPGQAAHATAKWRPVTCVRHGADRVTSEGISMTRRYFGTDGIRGLANSPP